jgi:hypothetical protein
VNYVESSNRVTSLNVAILPREGHFCTKKVRSTIKSQTRDIFDKCSLLYQLSS